MNNAIDSYRRFEEWAEGLSRAGNALLVALIALTVCGALSIVFRGSLSTAVAISVGFGIGSYVVTAFS